MTAILVTGYKNMELGIFRDQDRKVAVIKKAIKRDFIRFLDEGVEWFLFTGNLGFEVWALEIAKALQADYDVKLATIFPFQDHGKHWAASNQEKLQAFKKVDFVKYAFPTYENPRQFADFHAFLLEHTDGAYLFYDSEKKVILSFYFKK